MLDNDSPLDRYLCVAVDIQGYSGQEIHGQHDFQEALHDAIQGAASDARLDRPSWQKQEQGDGELALVPAGRDEPRMMDAYVTFLRARIERFNAPRMPERRMRVRLAFHSGWARRSALGYSGADVIAVGRLVGAPELKAALAAPADAHLGVIVSDVAFAVIRQGLTALPVAEFRPADVTVKEFNGRAWLWVPGATLGGTVPGAAGPAPIPRRPARSPLPVRQPTTRVTGNSGVVISGGSVSGPVAAGSGARACQGPHHGEPLPDKLRYDDLPYDDLRYDDEDGAPGESHP